MTVERQDYPSPFPIWRVAAWAGPIWLITFGLFWAVIAKFVPPPAEYWSTEEVYRFFSEHNLSIRVGMTGVLFFGPLYFVWTAVTSRVIQHIEGPNGVLSYIELIGGVLTTVVVIGVGIFWLAASFRMDVRTPQEIHLMSDIAWLIFNLTVAITMLQMISFGTAMLLDRRPKPLYPRWLAWLAYLTSSTFMFALAVPFLMRGPLAWHGLLTFYVALGLFFPWAAITMYLTFPAINTIQQECESATP